MQKIEIGSRVRFAANIRNSYVPVEGEVVKISGERLYVKTDLGNFRPLRMLVELCR